MNAFQYARPADVAEAISALNAPHDPVPPGTARNGAKFLAGGTNLVDLMKANVLKPALLVDVRRLGLNTIEATPEGGVSLGATATNADTAEHAIVRQGWPLLRSAILAGASPQIRNMATNGGNLLQRTRCVYFYDTASPCNKRAPGSGCPASSGLARQHAILGSSAQCVATHPSDLCVALAALDATVHVSSPRGSRAIAFEDFHRLPGDRPEIDTNLDADELITHITVPPNRFGANASYLKVRERASYAFALVSVAAALEIDAGGVIRRARLALGGVAHKPWRNVAAEAGLVGKQADGPAFEEAADLVVREAQSVGVGRGSNAFKITLARNAIVRALQMARNGVATNTGQDAMEARP